MIVHLQPIAIDVKKYRAFKKKIGILRTLFFDLGDPDLKVHVVTLIIMGGRHANSEDLRLLGQGNRIQKYLFDSFLKRPVCVFVHQTFFYLNMAEFIVAAPFNFQISINIKFIIAFKYMFKL